MKIFIDTANLDEIREAASWGILSGVTTNPTLIAKEGRDFKETIKEITEIVDGPISAEVLSDVAEDMVPEAKELSKIHKNVIIKVPMTAEGLKTTAILKKEDIKTNVTLVFSANQALLAARAGAKYVSPFVGRLDDISSNGVRLIEDIMEVFTVHEIKTKVIAASVRTPMDVIACAKAGADIVTIPFGVLKKMFEHPLTDTGIARFKKDWEDAKK